MPETLNRFEHQSANLNARVRDFLVYRVGGGGGAAPNQFKLQ